MACFHILYEPGIPIILHILAIIGTEDSEKAADKMLPIACQPAELLPREQQLNHIALIRRDAVKIDEYM
ncbi:hypothetical protein D3C78_1946810 [compost metagenome]